MISTKQQSIEMRDRLLFGNTWDFWPSINDYKKSQYKGLVAIQYRIRNSAFMRYDISYELFDSVVEEFVSKGAITDLMYVSKVITVEEVQCQGECCLLPTGLALHYNTKQVHMRPALQSGLHAEGIKATTILKYFMDGNSYDCLMTLFELYDHDLLFTLSVEFTVLDRSCGKLGWNTIFWEARHY